MGLYIEPDVWAYFQPEPDAGTPLTNPRLRPSVALFEMRMALPVFCCLWGEDFNGEPFVLSWEHMLEPHPDVTAIWPLSVYFIRNDRSSRWARIEKAWGEFVKWARRSSGVGDICNHKFINFMNLVIGGVDDIIHGVMHELQNLDEDLVPPGNEKIRQGEKCLEFFRGLTEAIQLVSNHINTDEDENLDECYDQIERTAGCLALVVTKWKNG